LFPSGWGLIILNSHVTKGDASLESAAMHLFLRGDKYMSI